MGPASCGLRLWPSRRSLFTEWQLWEGLNTRQGASSPEASRITVGTEMVTQNGQSALLVWVVWALPPGHLPTGSQSAFCSGAQDGLQKEGVFLVF